MLYFERFLKGVVKVTNDKSVKCFSHLHVLRHIQLLFTECYFDVCIKHRTYGTNSQWRIMDIMKSFMSKKLMYNSWMKFWELLSLESFCIQVWKKYNLPYHLDLHPVFCTSCRRRLWYLSQRSLQKRRGKNIRLATVRPIHTELWRKLITSIIEQHSIKPTASKLITFRCS